MTTPATQVRERPILFSGPMVRAILDGRKTQTRRVLGVQPLEILLPRDSRAASMQKATRVWNGSRVWFALTERDPNRGCAFRCKYGEVGDRLWVRETWAQSADQLSDTTMDTRLRYRADGEERARDNGAELPWRPSIHMPRWASRLMLEVTGVSVERVQDITEADARAEGIERAADGYWLNYAENGPTWQKARESFFTLWDSLNAARGHGWDVNPWVWVIQFKAVTP